MIQGNQNQNNFLFRLHIHDHVTNNKLYTVLPRYNTVVGRHLLRPPYKRGALWDPVDLFEIVIPRQRYPVPNVNVPDQASLNLCNH